MSRRSAQAVPRIGDSSAIDMERVVALHPDVVVVWEGGSNVGQVAQLERLGDSAVSRTRSRRLADLAPSLRRLGALAGHAAVAENSGARCRSAPGSRWQKRYGGRTPLTVLLQVWNRPIYTVGGTHMMTDSLRLCGARNMFADLKEQGPAVDVEAIIARDPGSHRGRRTAGHRDASGWRTGSVREPARRAQRRARSVRRLPPVAPRPERRRRHRSAVPERIDAKQSAARSFPTNPSRGSC